jgi:effector-binding domain-containing protein
MIDTPQVAQTTATIRFAIPCNEIQKVMGPAIGEVIAAVVAQGIGPAGPVFSHHFRMSPDIFDFEVGVPVTTPVTPVGRVQPSKLPVAKVMRTIYRGPYEGLGGAWGEFSEWLIANGHSTAENLWEFYVVSPESTFDPEKLETELNRPLLGTKS